MLVCPQLRLTLEAPPTGNPVVALELLTLSTGVAVLDGSEIWKSILLS